MEYIESHLSLVENPKFRKFCRLAGISDVLAMGHLHFLWHWAFRHAPDGDLSRFDAFDIADAAHFEGDAEKFMLALIRCGHDEPGFIEEYEDGSGKCLYGWETITGKTGKRLSPEAWNALRRIVFERDGYTCQYCGATGVELECDHVLPISRGGNNVLSNLKTACFDCNRSKSNKTLAEWRRV